MPNKIPGATISATASIATTGAATGLMQYKFTGLYDTRIDLSNVAGVNVIGGQANDEFLLGTSTGNILMGGAGNDEFVISATSSDLAGNIIMAAGGFNDVLFKGSGQTADLTAQTYGAQAVGIDAVVGGKALSGQTVDLTLGQIATTTLTGGIGKDLNRAFVAMIGADGVVNLSIPSAAKFVGVMDASGAGFDASGAPLDAATTAALDANVTSIGNVAGTIARSYTGSASAAVQSAALKGLDAYVFATAAHVYYTVWTDGTISTTDTLGNANTYTQPAPASTLLPYGLGTVQIFDTSGSYDTAKISTNAAGVTGIQLGGGTIAASASFNVGDVTGTIVQGDFGANGGDYFNLKASGGANTIIGSAANDVFDIGTSGALVDALQGGAGFNAVTVQGGGDVDLTSNNGSTATAAKNIQAVVGSLTGNTTVEVDLSKLAVVGGASIFEAFLGSAASTLTVSSLTGTWVEVGSFAPSAAASVGATALTDADFLNTLFGATKTYNAANALTGYLFEQVAGVGVHQHVVKTATVYTDATVVNATTPPAAAAALMSQYMASLGAQGPAMAVMSLANDTVTRPLLAAAKA